MLSGIIHRVAQTRKFQSHLGAAACGWLIGFSLQLGNHKRGNISSKAALEPAGWQARQDPVLRTWLSERLVSLGTEGVPRSLQMLPQTPEIICETLAEIREEPFRGAIWPQAIARPDCPSRAV